MNIRQQNKMLSKKAVPHTVCSAAFFMPPRLPVTVKVEGAHFLTYLPRFLKPFPVSSEVLRVKNGLVAITYWCRVKRKTSNRTSTALTVTGTVTRTSQQSRRPKPGNASLVRPGPGYRKISYRPRLIIALKTIFAYSTFFPRTSIGCSRS